jgi:hypothetical protein
MIINNLYKAVTFISNGFFYTIKRNAVILLKN